MFIITYKFFWSFPLQISLLKKAITWRVNGIILHVFCFDFLLFVYLFIFFYSIPKFSFLGIHTFFVWMAVLWFVVNDTVLNAWPAFLSYTWVHWTHTCLIVLWPPETLVREWKTHKSPVIGSWVCHFWNHGLLCLFHSIYIPALYSIYPIYGVLINIYFYIKLWGLSWLV